MNYGNPMDSSSSGYPLPSGHQSVDYGGLYCRLGVILGFSLIIL